MAQLTDQSSAPLAPDTRPEPRTAYDFALYRLLDDLFAAHPTWATQIGFHAFDDRWPDLTEAGRQGRLAMLRHHRARLQALPEAELSATEKIDRGIVIEAIDSIEFQDAELRQDAWDPLTYVSLAGGGFFSLLAREFAPWPQRGRAFVGRLRGLPALLDAAREALVGLPDRPVSLLHTETALAQLGGINNQIDEGVSEAERRAKLGDDDGLAQTMREAAGPARTAIDEFRAALDGEVRQRAEGEGRLGQGLFQAKLRHTLATDLPADELLARARRDYDAVRAEMVRLARELWPAWVPNQPLPDP